MVVGAVITVLALRGIDDAVDETNARQAAAATTAATALGDQAADAGTALEARIQAALATGEPAAEAYALVAKPGKGAASMAVDADGRILTGEKAGTKSALAAALTEDGSGFTVVPAADLEALGLSNPIAVKPTEVGVKVDTDEVTDRLAVVASGKTADGGRLITVRPLDDAALVDHAAKNMGAGAYVTIFQGDVRVNTTGKTNGKRNVGTTVSQKVHDAVYGGDKAFTGEAIVVDKTVISHYAPIRGADGKAIGMWYAGYLKSDVEAAASATRRNMLIVGVLVALIAAAVAVWFASRMLRPLSVLTPQMEAIAAGKIDDAPVIDRRDEFGTMATAFSEMVDYLREMAGAAERIGHGDLTVDVEPKSEDDRLGNAFKDMVGKLRELVGRLHVSASSVASASQEMSATSDEAGRAVTEIADAVGEVAAGAERQVRLVETTRETALAAARTAAESADSAGHTAEVAEETRAIAKEGVAAANEASEAIRALADTSRGVSAAIGELSTRSEHIGGIVATITMLAEQTNLLALNAAIEAARAGEQGRGFAVVAEEVRKLAEESQAAASQISQLIAEMQGETERVVAIVADSTHRTGEGVDTVERTREAFERIGTGVEDMSGRVTEIAQVVRTIAGDADRMQADIAGIAAVAESSSASAEQVSASTQETSATTQEIAASSTTLAGTAEDLREAIGYFKVETTA
ncbi:methyl-accepting chemotaxis protein [Solirubrobacter phytolaccae]|uniref:Methyl-accepting chemotaxis protein n=1 Tax=Solirubrobacter phytolaccae TaxID=1404360 RepID=A0A9X3NBB9_9ACTN|nr:methyl-accepting chemotaxis protein [Solirubrobacter phytolaccae]MDA0182806.1 methyl-accepting chemotaxis protein [Solirubrobacter phytolaccae]